MESNNLTQYEIPRLPQKFNLTDGHIHRSWDKNEEKIIDQLGTLFKEANRENQPKLERAYIKHFFKLGNQTVDFIRTKYLLCNSASSSLEIVANHLRLKEMSVALIEPCFDNLADIFKRHEIPLTPIPEKYLIEKNLKDFLGTLQSDALCLVSPNNPTGLFYTKENLKTIAEYCKENKKLLILDASFGLYNDKAQMFDEYLLLNSIGVEYICIEDTGKVWPTHDIKISVLACTPNMYDDLYRIYTDFILHVSPFSVKLLTEFFKNSERENLYQIHNIVQTNRTCLYKAIEKSFLKPTEKSCASVAWLKIENDLTATKLKRILDEHGIFVLPGNQFFWSNSKQGEKFIRVALTREPALFIKAMRKFRKVLLEIAEQRS